MVCSFCGAVQAAMKTIYFPEEGDEGDEHSCCEGCYEAVRGEVLIVPGVSYAWAWCTECQGWRSLNDMASWSGGGPRGAPQGACFGCAGMPG